MSGRPSNPDRQRSIEQGLPTYIGKPCKNCTNNIRQTWGGKCIVCDRVSRRGKRSKITDKKRVYQKKYRDNQDKEKRYLNHIKWKYGLEADDYRAMQKQQKFKCVICDREIELVVDHCHRTGKVRGLLCQRCNTTLGVLNEDVKIIENMLRYMNENSDSG